MKESRRQETSKIEYCLRSSYKIQKINTEIEHKFILFLLSAIYIIYCARLIKIRDAHICAYFPTFFCLWYAPYAQAHGKRI